MQTLTLSPAYLLLKDQFGSTHHNKCWEHDVIATAKSDRARNTSAEAITYIVMRPTNQANTFTRLLRSFIFPINPNCASNMLVNPEYTAKRSVGAQLQTSSVKVE